MERAPELERVITEWWEAFSQGDGGWFFDRVSRDAGVRLAGTDAVEWVEGPRAREHLRSVVESLAGSLQIAPGEPVAFREGSVGWGSTCPTLSLPDGQRITFRWSGVFHREREEWKAVQLHASVAVPDEELLGES